jgi:hypothetical protein
MSRREIEVDQLAAEGGFLVVKEEPAAGVAAAIRSNGKIPLNDVVEIRREASGRYRVVIEFTGVEAGPSPARVPGSAKGLFTVPDDFDAPLDEFSDYM